MPRPGPRPYECVRRAWHSDRHQPMRGSLIKEIFRIVNEIHSAATKKNKEWQEKLPLVVLKAEEVMYSKANSEVEYMDLKTLADRASDAINIIIRRDEAAETGDLLPPCVEAALNIGCIPRRASRSQRQNTPGCYLSPSMQEANDSSVTSRIPDDTAFNSCAHLVQCQSTSPVLERMPQFMPRHSSRIPSAPSNATHAASDSLYPPKHAHQSGSSLLAENSTCWQGKSSFPLESHFSPNLGLTHQSCNRSNSFANGIPFLYPQVSNHVAVGLPCAAGMAMEGGAGMLQSLPCCGNPLDDSIGNNGASKLETEHGKPFGMGCDLSL